MPESFDAQNQGEKPSMTELQTLEFLREKGIKPLGDDWQPHQPLLYVLKEKYRGKKMTGEGYPVDKAASIARIHDPVELHFIPPTPESERFFVPYVKVEGGQVDFYAVNAETKEPFHVGTSRPAKGFYIEKENLFTTADELFPPSRL